MTDATAHVSEFYDFPARGYLEKYYSEMGTENVAFAASITDYLWTRSVATDTVIEVAGGPCLYSLLALMATRGRPFAHVTFTDIGWKNLREVECWLRDEPSQFHYGALLAWLQAELGADADAVAQFLRRSNWELTGVDWREPVRAGWRRRYDVVSCHFFAESATNDEAELISFLQKLSALGRPGATLLTSFICRSAGYRIQGRDFPAFAVDESTIFDFLDRAGIDLDDVEVRTVAAENPASNPGYEGLLFVGGRLPG